MTQHLLRIARGERDSWMQTTITAEHTWLSMLALVRNHSTQRRRPKFIVIHHVQADPPGMLDPAFQEGILEPLDCALRAIGCRLIRATLLRNVSDRATSAAFYNHVPHEMYSEWVSEHATDGTLSFLLHNRLRLRRNNRTVPMTADDLLRAQQALGIFDIIGRTEQLPEFLKQVDLQLLGPRAPSSSILGGDDVDGGHGKSVAAEGHENPTPAAQKYRLSPQEQNWTRAHTSLDERLYIDACAARWCSRQRRPLCRQEATRWENRSR